MSTNDQFSWARFPAEARRALARSLEGRSRLNDDDALDILAHAAPWPDLAFLRRASVLDWIFKMWLPLDPIAVNAIYAAASSDSGKRRTDGTRRRLARLRKQRRTQGFLEVVLEALLAAGGRVGP